MSNTYNHTPEVQKQLSDVNKYIQDKVQSSELETQEELLAFSHGIASTWLTIGAKLSEDKRAFIEDTRKEAYEIVLASEPDAFIPLSMQDYLYKKGENPKIDAKVIKTVGEKVSKIFKLINRELSEEMNLKGTGLSRASLTFLCVSGQIENFIDAMPDHNGCAEMFEDVIRMIKGKYSEGN